jgi:hypothetical protein
MKKCCAVIILLFFANSASAEFYVGGGGGVTLDAEVNDYENTYCSFIDLLCDNEITRFKGSDLDLDGSGAFGGKMGYFFSGLPWLGFEFTYFQRGIEAKQQRFTASGANSSTLVPALPFDGQMAVQFSDLRTLGFLILLRPTENIVREYFFNRLEPYAGAGISGSWVEVESIATFDAGGTPVASNNSGESEWGLGMLISAGMNVKITENLKAYTEYKYSQAHFRFEDLDDFATEMDIADHSLMFGLSYSFGSGQ